MWVDAATTIAGTTFLLLNRFAPMTQLLHGLCDIAGWTLILFCFFSQSSRWQSISFSAVYLILLSGIHWKKYLSIYQGINAYILIAIFVLWLVVSALTYLFLSRHKASAPAAGLN